MKKEEKKLTVNQLDVDNLVINDSLEVYNKLLKIGISGGLTIAEISAKTGLNKQSIYRYKSDYDSQKKTFPKLNTILKLSSALGYEIRLCKVID